MNSSLCNQCAASATISVDWVFNASHVLKERAEMMALHEGMTYERDAEKRAPYAKRSLDFIDRITNTLSKKMVRKVKNRWGVDIWPWDREAFQRTMALWQKVQNFSDNKGL
jgi:hypothetical protein